jgi:hypothetical protein
MTYSCIDGFVDMACALNAPDDEDPSVTNRHALAEIERLQQAANFGTTFIPENPHGVKPGYCTRPDIVRLLRMHRMYPERIEFIANMMEG